MRGVLALAAVLFDNEHEPVTLQEVLAMSPHEAAGLDLPAPAQALECPCSCHDRRFGRLPGWSRVPQHGDGRNCPCQSATAPQGSDAATQVQETLSRPVRALVGLDDVADPEAAIQCRCYCHMRRFGHPRASFHQGGADCRCQQPDDPVDHQAEQARAAVAAKEDLDKVLAGSIEAAVGIAELRDVEAALACHCSCHSRRFGQPADGLHDGGASCNCQLTAAEREESSRALFDLLATAESDEDRQERQHEYRDRLAAATALAEQLQISQLVVEADGYPTEFHGVFRGRYFHYRDKHGFTLRADGPDGPVVAADGARLPEAVRLVAAILTGRLALGLPATMDEQDD